MITSIHATKAVEYIVDVVMHERFLCITCAVALDAVPTNEYYWTVVLQDNLLRTPA